MSEDETPKDPPIAHTESSRRQMLKFVSAFGVALAVPSVALGKDAEAPSFDHIPHAHIVAKAMQDPKWREQLVRDPKQTLADAGIVLARDVEVKVVEDSRTLIHVVLCSHEGMRGPELGSMAAVLTRFREDQAFRREIEGTPRSVFEQLSGATLPSDLEVVSVLEKPLERVIHLPAAESDAIITPAQADDYWGGDDDDPLPPSTIESGQICNCYSENSDYNSMIVACCTKDPEPIEPIEPIIP